MPRGGDAERRFRCLAVTRLAYIEGCGTEAGDADLPTEIPKATFNTARLVIDGNKPMKFLSYAYRFSSNFVFLSLVYFSLNFLGKYQQRVIVAILVLAYSAMHSASALRSFYFFQKVERLEAEARRLAVLAGEGPSASAQRKQIVSDVGGLRRAGEMNAYIDLLFLALVVLLCVSKIVTD
jgi:hypothetical protein